MSIRFCRVLILSLLVVTSFPVTQVLATTFEIKLPLTLVLDLTTAEELERYRQDKVPEKNIAFLKQPKIRTHMAGKPVGGFKGWTVKEVTPSIIHLKRKEWGSPYLELDLEEPAAYLIFQGTFGQLGGQRGEEKYDQISSGRSGDYLVEIPSAILSFTPNKKRLDLSFQGLPIADLTQFRAHQKSHYQFRIGHSHWSTLFWEANTKTHEVWEVHGTRDLRKIARYLKAVEGAYAYHATAEGNSPKASPTKAVAKILPWPVDKGVQGQFDRVGESPWYQKIKALYRPLFGKGYDTLLVPVQVNGYAVDRSGRHLMTKFLHQRLQQAGMNLPNPSLVTRALGENERTFHRSEVFAFANELGVQRVIVPSVGHDGRGRLNINLLHLTQGQENEFSESSPYLSSTKKDLPFSDEDLPFEVLLAQLEGQLKEIRVPKSRPRSTQTGGARETLSMPESPQALVARTDLTPLENASSLQLLGAIHPGGGDRDDLFQRSLVAAWNLKKTTPGRRLLIARSLYYLKRRPAALKFLGTPKTAEEKAFRAFLDGNLIELGRLRKTITSPRERILADLAYADLNYAYTYKPLPEGELRELAGRFQGWSPLMMRRLLDHDRWNSQPNLYVKNLMDQAFPIEGFTAESIAESRRALGKPLDRGGEVELVAFEHFQRYLEQHGQRMYAESRIDRLHKIDYLNLLYSTSEANLIHKLGIIIGLKSLPDRGLETLRRYAAVYHGHEGLLYWEREAYLDKASHRSGQQQQNLQRAADRLRTQRGAWYQGQLHRPKMKAYDLDFPKRYYWLEGPNRLKALENSLLYTNSYVGTAKDLYSAYKRQGKNKKVKALLAQLETRFIGSPERNSLLAKIYEEEGDSAKAVAFYTDATERMPGVWEPYRKLAELNLKQGKVEEAYQQMYRFPPFHQKNPRERVGLSNYAYEAAQFFYAMGEVQKARPFLEVAERLRTGSGAGVFCAATIDTIDGDCHAAAKHFQTGARRYKSGFFFGGFVRNLHLLGEHKKAWAVLETLPPDQYSRRVWEAAMIGHRMQATTDNEIDNWVARRKDSYEVEHFYLQRMIDRPPIHLLRLKPGARRFSRFIETYQSLKIGTTARDYLGHQAQSGKNLQLEHLPYVAFNYKISGRLPRFKELFADYKKDGREGFDQYLTEGILAGFDGHTEKSLEYFDRAWTQIPLQQNHNMPPLYKMAEFCEWLYTHTKDEQYLKAALKYARKRLARSPYTSWAHAMVANYGETPEDRMEALGIALYLDPQSLRVSGVEEAKKAEARKRFQMNNPFTLPKGKGQKI